jgi:uncharacterized protein (DUF2141 family)
LGIPASKIYQMNSILLIAILTGSWLKEDTLTVISKNVEVGKGTVMVAIWNDEKLFLKTPFLSKSLPADQTSLEFSFVLPDGEYAISLFQDINNNGKLDLGLFNIPKEPTGFGNNFRPKFSAPKFKDCSVILVQSMTTEIELK